ncbi:MAG: hypothetical protein PV344_00005, partial [Anaplasma sp.]|nr:hypothetical protein [Anaplasma sp.]
DKSFVEQIYVMPAQDPPLLGFLAIQVLGVVKFVDNASGPEMLLGTASENSRKSTSSGCVLVLDSFHSACREEFPYRSTTWSEKSSRSLSPMASSGR